MENSLLEYVILGSGSSANSYVLKDGNSLYVVDNGFSCREFEKRLTQAGLNAENIELIFLTHTHGDHIKGVELLSRKYSIPVVCHEKIDLQAYFKKPVQKLDIQYDREYPYKGITFFPFKTFHDASCSMGFSFDFSAGKITIITDTGKVSEEMKPLAAKSDLLFLESNYSKKMLAEGFYPERLKKRISSNKGHLSNEDAALFLEEISRMKGCCLKQVYLCHLSKNNNSPEQALAEISENFKGNIHWRICRRNELVLSSSLNFQLIAE